MGLKVSGIQGVIIFLFVVATFGSLHMLAASKPDTKLSKMWIALGF